MILDSKLKPPKEYRILVYVGCDLIGDGLMKLPFMAALREAFPKAHIVWIAGKGKSVFCSSLKPVADQLLNEVYEERGIGESLQELFKKPLQEHFDLIIDTQRRFKTSFLLKATTNHTLFLSGCAGFFFSSLKPQKKLKSLKMADQLFDLLKLVAPNAASPLTIPLPKTSESLAGDLLPQGPSYMGLVPGAGGRHKCWPLKNYQDLALSLLQKGHVPVFLLGPNENEWQGSLRKAVPEALFPLQDKRIVGQTSPFLTIALAARLKGAVSNDCGTGHMIALSACPLLSLFGPTSPLKFAPMTPRLMTLRAQEFGSTSEMSAIPLKAVEEKLEELLKTYTKSQIKSDKWI